MDKTRTPEQNKALHLYFTQISNSLLEHGVTVRDLLEAFKEDDVAPTGDNVKLIWKSILKRKHDKVSTTQMTTEDLNSVFNEFNMKMSILTGENIEFPSEETKQLLEHYSKTI